MLDPLPLKWRKSSYSTGTGQECAEAAQMLGKTFFRDSKNPEKHIKISATEWVVFMNTAKRMSN